jgi:hypothetical protein
MSPRPGALNNPKQKRVPLAGKYSGFLHRAAERGDETMLLAALKIDGNLLEGQDPSGNRALHLAARRGHVKICQILCQVQRAARNPLQARVRLDPPPRPKATQTASLPCRAAHRHPRLPVPRAALLPCPHPPPPSPRRQCGAALDGANNAGRTPLQEAVDAGHTVAAQLLTREAEERTGFAPPAPPSPPSPPPARCAPRPRSPREWRRAALLANGEHQGENGRRRRGGGGS